LVRQLAATTTRRSADISQEVRGNDFIAAAGGIVALIALILLWRARPSNELWLIGSLLWAGVTYPAFFWYVTQD
jgi:hypothetical protein